MSPDVLITLFCDLWWCIIQWKPTGHAAAASAWTHRVWLQSWFVLLQIQCFCCNWASISTFIAVIHTCIECLWCLFISTFICSHKHLNENSVTVAESAAKTGEASCAVYYIIYWKEEGRKGDLNDKGAVVSGFWEDLLPSETHQAKVHWCFSEPCGEIEDEGRGNVIQSNIFFVNVR